MERTKQDIEKDLNILVQTKGQLEASVTKVEKHLNITDFADYCDSIQTCITYNLVIQKTLKDEISTISLSDNSDVLQN